jgi:POT family proton-dependent oligopeptide transporter
MKSTIMSLWFLTLAAGSWLTGVVTRNVQFESKSGYFFFWAMFMLAGSIAFAVVAALYKPVEFVAASDAAERPAAA